MYATTSEAPVVSEIVIELEEVLRTFVGLPIVVWSFEVHANVDVLVNAGLIELITALFDANVASPPNTLAVAPPDVFAHTEEPEVAPQNRATGIPAVVVGNVNVPVLLIVAITGAVRVLAVNVCVATRVTTVSLVPGNVMVVASVPAKVRLLLMTAALPFATLIVPVVGLLDWVAIAFQP